MTASVFDSNYVRKTLTSQEKTQYYKSAYTYSAMKEALGEIELSLQSNGSPKKRQTPSSFERKKYNDDRSKCVREEVYTC